MWFERRREVRGIQTWLDIACIELCDDAKVTISSEINAHYTDAYESATALGLAPRDAAHHALRSLGDPYMARKGFRKVHLTSDELRRLYPSAIRRRIATLCAAIVWVVMALDPEVSQLFVPILLTGLVGRLWLRGRQPIPRLIVFYTTLAAAMLLAGHSQEKLLNIFMLAWLIAFAAMFDDDIRLQRKLRRTTSSQT